MGFTIYLSKKCHHWNFSRDSFWNSARNFPRLSPWILGNSSRVNHKTFQVVHKIPGIPRMIQLENIPFSALSFPIRNHQQNSKRYFFRNPLIFSQRIEQCISPDTSRLSPRGWKISGKIHGAVSLEILEGIFIAIDEDIHGEFPGQKLKYILGRSFKGIPEGVPKGVSKVILAGFLWELFARNTDRNSWKNWWGNSLRNRHRNFRLIFEVVA